MYFANGKISLNKSAEFTYKLYQHKLWAICVFVEKLSECDKYQRLNLLMLNDSWKKQGAEDPKAHCSHKNFGGSWTVFSTFFGICQIKKYIYQSESITLTHAVVNLTINSKVKMESRIVMLFIVGFNITNSLNHKL